MTFKHALLTIILVGFVAYVNTLWGSFVWDDEQFIQRNLYITSLEYIPQIFSTNTVAGAGHSSNYYRPITTLSFAIDHMIWKFNPFGFHLTNMLLHMAAAVVLWRLLIKIRVNQWVSLAISLIFLVHPVQTEAVSYANSRGDSLSAKWLFFSFWLMVKAVYDGKWLIKIGKVYILGKYWLYFLVICSYLLSLLSKEIVIAMWPVFVAIPLLYQWQEKRPFKKLFSEQRSALLAALLIGFLVIGYFSLRLSVLNFGNTLNFYGYETEYTQNLGIRLMTFARVIWVYLGILIWPYPLHMERDVALVTQWWSWEVIAAVLLVVGLIAAGWWQLIKQRRPWVLVGLVWLGGTLIPVSGIVPINGILYEHWLYLPIIGLMLIGYGLFGQLVGKYLKLQWLLWILGVMVTIYVMLTIRQNYIWGDPIRFYEYTLKYSQSARLHNNLAMSYSEQKRLDEAIDQYNKALALSEAYPQTYHNLGNAYFDKGEVGKAEEAYKMALKLDPTFFFTYPKIINLYLTTGELPKTIPYLDRMLEIDPQNVEVWMIYGKVLTDLDQPELSKQKFDQVRKLTGGGPQIEAQIQRLLAIPKPASSSGQLK